MLTLWGEQPDRDHILPEYPRPQMQRENYTILNGLWDYAITASEQIPTRWDGQILVPFSPEAPLSGVEPIITLCDFNVVYILERHSLLNAAILLYSNGFHC